MNIQLQINPPEGYEIDHDRSGLSKGIVHFKECKKKLTYSDIAEKMRYSFSTQNIVIDISEGIIRDRKSVA